MEKTSIVQIDKKYAILVGINSYFDDIIRSLNYSVADVEAFCEILTDSNRGNYNQENIRLMTDGSSQQELKPFRSNIMSQISSLSSMATTNDQLLMYFSGHGIEKDNQSYLLPQDARYNVLGESAIKFEWIKSMLVSSNARVKIVILDACHSGAIKGKTASGYMTRGFQESIFPAPQGFAVLSSCALNEVSWENEELKHGVFSYFLTEALRGAADYDRDGNVTIMEANKYTFEKVSSWALANSRNQSPFLNCEIFGDVVICKVPPEYIPPSPVEILIKNITLETSVLQTKSLASISGKICALLLDYLEPDGISYDDKGIVFDGGNITQAKTFLGGAKIRCFFDYDEAKRETVDKIISDLLGVDELGLHKIEFAFSSEIDLNYLVKSCRQRGFKIKSFNPALRIVEIELLSELEEVVGITFFGKEEGSSIVFSSLEPFEKGFYNRINPKSVMEFFVLSQKKSASV
ncbi:MAG: caspase family protein [Candidatus Bathyarchaeota archaeon]|nr:caspase family protein [Candidatus Bathyarchaeota archaeon]